MVVAACSKHPDATTVTVPPAAVPTAVATSGGATTTTTTIATTTAVATTTTSTTTTASSLDPSHRFEFRAPPTDQKDVGLLDVYRNFMAIQEQIGLHLSDPGLRAQLAAVTTSQENAVLQKAFDELVAKGASYRVVEPVTYHPFVLYGDGYRDGLRTVGDCFIEAAAYVDSAGNPLPGETLARLSKGFVAEFELHGGQWLASASQYDASNCLVS
jgi:hypothetical protein